MKLSDVSIARPVFTTMVMSALIAFGILLYTRLGVDMFPEVNFPIVTVTTVYPGADTEAIEEQIVEPIEEVVASLSGIRSVRSVSLENLGQVIVEFDLDIDAGAGAQEVRDAISTITTFPSGSERPIVQKIDLGAAPVIQIALTGPDSFALQADARDRVVPALEGLDGVGQVTILGGREQEMHVWLNPVAMRSFGLTVSDVSQALAANNIELPSGRVIAGTSELSLRTDASAPSAQELGKLVVADRGGYSITLNQIAEVELGLEEERSTATVTQDGQITDALVVVVRKQSDANTVAVADNVREALPGISEALGEGTNLQVLVDNSVSIRASLETVQLDILLGAFLAIIIILVFLRDFRATLISATALPVSVIGTFGFVQIMGFTLNMMTTLALSLSIGILIDDAIVVIENIVRRKSLGENAMDAAKRGTAEIGMAVLATTFSIVAVFVPVAFMDGMMGQFFYEFGITVAFAVLLSLFVSFTLTPMLSSRFLGSHHESTNPIAKGIEKALTGLDHGYRRIVSWSLRHRAISLVLALGALFGSFFAFPLLGFEFIPIDDKGQFSVTIETPRGTSLEATMEAVTDASARIHQHDWVASTFEVVGGSAQERVDQGEIIVTMIPKADRPGLHMVAAMTEVRQALQGATGYTSVVQQISNVGGGGRNAPLQLDLRGPNTEELIAASERLVATLEATPGFVDVDSSAQPLRDDLRVHMLPALASDQGVMNAQVATTVRALIAGDVATQVSIGGERIDVRVQLKEDERNDVTNIQRAQVRNMRGQLVEVQTVAELVNGQAPSQIDRESRQRQVSIYANLEDIALGDAIPFATQAAIDAIGGADIRVAPGGNAKMLGEAVASMGLALFLAILCVYMILASQFESFVHPLTIMASLPFALIGAVGGLLITQMHMSIFAMIGLIMLMGLVTKNAILLIDFALEKVREGFEVDEALEEAGATRLRPILMTTAAMIFGMLPVAIGHGDGGEVRAPMGVTVIGGLITSTILTLVVVPVIHSLINSFRSLLGRIFGRGKAPSDHSAEEPSSEGVDVSQVLSAE